MPVITTDIWNQCLRNKKRLNYIKCSRYVHNIVTCWPLSDLYTLFIRLDSSFFFFWSQIILTCFIKVVIESKTTISYENLQEVLAINRSIPAKVTESSIIVKYLWYFQKLAQQANLTSVTIVEDMGAASAELKLVWNCSEEFGNVIIHLGDFHVMKKNLQVNMDLYVLVLFVFLLI